MAMDVRRGSVGSNGKGVRMGTGCAGRGPASQPLSLVLCARPLQGRWPPEMTIRSLGKKVRLCQERINAPK